MAFLIESRPLLSARQGTCHGLTLVTCPTALTTRCTWATCSTRMNHKRCSQCQGSFPLIAELWFMRSFMMNKIVSLSNSTLSNSVANSRSSKWIYFLCKLGLLETAFDQICPSKFCGSGSPGFCSER